MRRLGGDILVETGYQGANVSCILTEKGKVLVDVPYFPQEVNEWRQLVAQAAPGEVAYIIDTDHHFDHAIGNWRFGGKVVGHQHTYDEMSRPGGTLLEGFIPNIEAVDPSAAAEIKKYPIVLPDITFDHSLTLHMGDKTLEIIHTGGHTPATSSVYIPELKVLLAGDMVVNGTHPFIGQGDSAQWMRSLEAIKKMDIVEIVPGHGEVCGMEAVERLMAYFKELRRQVEALLKAKKKREEIFEHLDIMDFFPVEEASRPMALFCVQSAAARIFDEVTASS